MCMYIHSCWLWMGLQCDNTSVCLLTVPSAVLGGCFGREAQAGTAAGGVNRDREVCRQQAGQRRRDHCGSRASALGTRVLGFARQHALAHAHAVPPFILAQSHKLAIINTQVQTLRSTRQPSLEAFFDLQQQTRHMVACNRLTRLPCSFRAWMQRRA
jgi:hypothetical protein